MTGPVTFEFVAQLVGGVGLAVGVVVYFLRELGRRDIEFERYKTYVAEHYASKTSVGEQYRHLAESLEKLTDRLDRFLERAEK